MFVVGVWECRGQLELEPTKNNSAKQSQKYSVFRITSPVSVVQVKQLPVSCTLTVAYHPTSSISLSFYHNTFETLRLLHKATQFHRPIRQDRGQIAFSNRSLKYPSPKLRLFRTALNSYTDYSDIFVYSSGWEKQGAWKLFAEISSEPAAVLYSCCAPPTSASHLRRHLREPKQFLYAVQVFSSRSSFLVGFLHLYVSLHAFLEIGFPSAGSSCIMLPANTAQGGLSNDQYAVPVVYP